MKRKFTPITRFLAALALLELAILCTMGALQLEGGFPFLTALKNIVLASLVLGMGLGLLYFVRPLFRLMMRLMQQVYPAASDAALVRNNVAKYSAILFATAWCLFLAPSVLTAQITGSVFRDFNGNGTKDANDPLVPGITVNAYNVANTLCGSATTSGGNTATNYSLSGCGTGAVRVEFVLPSSGICVASGIDFSALSGTTYGSSVQFVNGNSSNVNFAVSNPGDYNTGAANTSSFIPCYVNGDPLPTGSASGAEAWFVGFGYNTTGSTTTPPAQKVGGAVIGSTWGTAYSKQAKKIFVAAFIKRHVGLGTLGSGGIYLLEPTTNSFNVSTFYDMDANGHRTRADGTAPAYGSGSSFTIASNSIITFSGTPDALTGLPKGLGVVGTNVERSLSTNPIIPGYDPAAFDQTGKVGLGDIDISDDGQYLFVMNLYSRRVFRLKLNDPFNPTSVIEVVSYAVPDPGCTNGTYRPFGLKFDRGKLYVGVVCSAENSGATNANLSAQVYELNNATATATFNTTAVVSISNMTYDRQNSSDWRPWSNNSDRGSSPIRYAQPILSDIDVNERGDIIMGFMDRAGNQYGNDNYKFLQTSTTTTDNHSSGEILIAGVDCSTGGFTVENNGQFTSNGISFASNHTSLAATTQGIGGREFFDDYSAAGDPHAETAQGALALLKGTGEVMTSAFAIVPILASDAGVSRYSTSDGTFVSGYALYGGSAASGNFFGKASGLGDLDLSGVTSPIEIGNRVWMDTDNDGIQDADEMGIGSVTVKLYRGATQVGQTTTASNGTYYFNNSNVNLNGATGLLPNTAYVIRVDAANFPSGKSLSTNQNVGGAGQPDVRDNDAALNAGNAEIAVTTGNYGENNHTLDMAFFACINPTATAAATQPTCSGSVAQSNGTITISSFTAGQRYQYSAGATFNSGAATPASITAIPVGGVITSTLPNTTQQYTVRIYDATDAACYVDRVVSITAVTCGTAPSCACKEFIYVNEVDFNFTASSVHKFEVNGGTGGLSEIGNPWFSNASALPFPHGLGTDRNGYLYIGSTAFNPNTIRRLNCAGTIVPTFTQDPVNGFNTANVGNGLYNIDSHDGFIYSNGESPRIYKWDPCTGALLGYVQLDDGSDDWGFHIDDNGKFYVTNMSGKIYVFTPTPTDFMNNTVYSPAINLNANPSYGGLSPAYSLINGGLGGITTDNGGNIYVVEGNRDGVNTSSRLLKFSSTYTLLGSGPIDANGNDNGGWNQMVGIVYSKNSNRLYTTSLNTNEDCVRRWTTSLVDDGVAIGPVPGAAPFCKGIAILSECCPTSGTVDISNCDATTSSRVSLSDLMACEGVVCEGQWTLQPGSSNLTFNACDLTITPTAFPACGTFTLTNVGTPNASCAPYTITVNVSLLANVTAQAITGDATVCAGENPAAFAVVTQASTTPPGSTITYQWQRSTVSCTTGFSNINGEMSATYDPGPITQTTYYRVIASIAGCTNGACSDTSNCVTLTFDSNCPLCPNPPSVVITEGNVGVCGTGLATFNYTVTNGPATITTSNGTLANFSTTTLNNGTGTFTYTPAVSEIGTVINFTATIADPDGAGACTGSTDNATVTSTMQKEAGTGGPTTICETSSSTITLSSLLTGADAGGTWTAGGSNPAGGTFTAASGTFNPTGASVGTYTFTYAFAAIGACAADQTTVTINVTDQREAGTGSSTTICVTSTTLIDLFGLLTGEETGGTWTAGGSNPSGGTFTAGTGSFNPTGVSVGTYTFTYTFAATGNCAQDQATVTVVVSNQSAAGIGGSTTICETSTTTITLFSLITGGDAGGAWTAGGSNPSGGTFTAGTGTFNPTGATPGTYTFTYAFTAGGGCAAGQTTVTVNVIDLPVITTIPGSICQGSTINLATLVTGNTPAGTLTYYTSLAAANAAINALANTTVAPSATTTYYVRSQITSVCYTIAPITVNVNGGPDFSVTNGAVCVGGSINLATLVTNTSGGTLSYHTSLAAAQSGAPALASTTVSPTSATNYYVRSTNGSGCFIVKELTVSILPQVCGTIQITGPNNN